MDRGGGAALSTFAAIGARYETACTRLDLAAALHARGDSGAAGVEIAEAHRALAALGAPRHAARAAELAARLGLPLSA